VLVEVCCSMSRFEVLCEMPHFLQNRYDLCLVTRVGYYAFEDSAVGKGRFAVDCAGGDGARYEVLDEGEAGRFAC